METPSNPGLKLVDIEKVAAIVRSKDNILLAIDNTFLSPYFQVLILSKSNYSGIYSDASMCRGHLNSG